MPEAHWSKLTPPVGDSGLPTDTYFSTKEWSLTSATAGINILSAWQNYTGLGIKVAIVDDGIDYNHPDLSAHYRQDLDYDARDHDGDAYVDPVRDTHGTTVAGILGAERDGVGIVGVAYDADLAGVRIGYGSYGNAGQYGEALSLSVLSQFDVVNASWGYSLPYEDNFYSDWHSSALAIQDDVANGRGGLGINIVFCAMNNRSIGDNVNYHNYQNDPYVITVAATDNTGHAANYSNPGAAVLVAAPGSSLYTDDVLGSGGKALTDYVSVSGTSYSAPIVSGIIALMLQANPDLGYRDVQEILAYSAKNSDPSSAGWQTNGANNWNGGGLHFSNDYGFGLVDATAAVRLAESWHVQSTFADMVTESVSHVDHAAIPDGQLGLTSSVTLGESLTLDKVVVDLDITHQKPSDLTVTLTSPSGTTAVLAANPATGTGGGIVFETSANNFWGEDAKGDWTLTVTDRATGSVGTLNGWSLKALGDAPSDSKVYIYTDEFANAPGDQRAVLHDSSGDATINTAAVTSNSYLDLHPGAVSTVAGRQLQIGGDTTIKNVWAGDGADTIIANDAGNVIQGGRGNDIIVAGNGSDVLFGGPGNDTFVFNNLSSARDLIADFAPGNDVINLHGLLTAAGWHSSDALDQWLTTAQNVGGGTDFLLNRHDGHAPAAFLTVADVSPDALAHSTNWLVA